MASKSKKTVKVPRTGSRKVQAREYASELKAVPKSKRCEEYRFPRVHTPSRNRCLLRKGHKEAHAFEGFHHPGE